MVKKARLTKEQMAVIRMKHGNSDGSLNLHDVKTKSKVQVKNPLYLEHKGVIIASGFHPQHEHRISQIVHHK